MNYEELGELANLRRQELLREAEQERLARKISSNRPASTPFIPAILAFVSFVIVIIAL
jgi:hypothetical protein